VAPRRRTDTTRPAAVRTAGGAAALLALAVACGDEPDAAERSAREAREAWCGAACSSASRCGESAGVSCAPECPERPTALFERMTSAALRAQADCLAAAPSCDAGLEALLDACAAQAWADLEATEASLATCDVMATPFFECGWFASFEQCASYHAVFQAPALEAWQGCSGVRDCDVLDDCMAVTLYGYGG
jgi:hypothetical protein